MAVAEAADPDATVSPAEAAADETAGVQDPATDSGHSSAAAGTASPDAAVAAAEEAPGPGLRPSPVDDASFEGGTAAAQAGVIGDSEASVGEDSVYRRSPADAHLRQPCRTNPSIHGIPACRVVRRSRRGRRCCRRSCDEMPTFLITCACVVVSVAPVIRRAACREPRSRVLHP